MAAFAAQLAQASREEGRPDIAALLERDNGALARQDRRAATRRVRALRRAGLLDTSLPFDDAVDIVLDEGLPIEDGWTPGRFLLVDRKFIAEAGLVIGDVIPLFEEVGIPVDIAQSAAGDDHHWVALNGVEFTVARYENNSCVTQTWMSAATVDAAGRPVGTHDVPVETVGLVGLLNSAFAATPYEWVLADMGGEPLGIWAVSERQRKILWREAAEFVFYDPVSIASLGQELLRSSR